MSFRLFDRLVKGVAMAFLNRGGSPRAPPITIPDGNRPHLTVGTMKASPHRGEAFSRMFCAIERWNAVPYRRRPRRWISER